MAKEIPKFPETSESRKRFDELYQKITGTNPDQAEINEKGWLFLPPEASKTDPEIRDELTKLAGPDGWKNYLENDEYAGYWIRRPE